MFRLQNKLGRTATTGQAVQGLYGQWQLCKCLQAFARWLYNIASVSPRTHSFLSRLLNVCPAWTYEGQCCNFEANLG